MKKILLLSILSVLFVSCDSNNKKFLEKENEELKTDTMLQNKTIRRLFKEKDSLENKILLDSLKKYK